MISKTKNIVVNIFLLIITWTIIGFLNNSLASYETFLEDLKDVGIYADSFLDKDGLSRYELTRLLNAVECKDCINPDQNFVNRYNSNFWSNFKLVAGNNFNDISYLGGMRNNQSYYYCVAYVGDEGYMNGYPLDTSPVCAGKFCGNQLVNKAEFIQVVINIISNYIYKDLNTNRNKIKSWINGLEKESYAYKTFDTEDLKIIENNSKSCGNKSCQLNNGAEVKTYLKYCMFNLAECGMLPIGKIGQGYRPVAELNLLKNQSLLEIDKDYRDDVGGIMDVDKIFETIYNLNMKVDCDFNPDYDCDGVLNSADNCSIIYNPSQNDFDKDKIGDVCDDDVDNDGAKNPIGIIDENGRINIRLWTKITDNCLFVKNTDQRDENGNGIGDACDDVNQDYLSMYILVSNFSGTAPLTVQFRAMTNTGNNNDIERVFSDGGKGLGKTINHTFYENGIYNVKALAKGKLNDAYASTTVIVGKDPSSINGIGIISQKVGGKAPLETNLSVYSVGKYDWVSRNFGDKEIIENQDRSFKKLFTTEGTYPVSIKAIKDGIVEGISKFNIGVGENYPGSILKTSFLSPEVGKKISLETEYDNFYTKDISYVEWNRGDGIVQKNKELSNSHIYSIEGQRVIVQKIVLKDGVVLTNMITVFVFDKKTFRSSAIVVVPSTLQNNVGGKIGFNINIVGDSLDNFINVIFQYLPSITQIIPSYKEYINLGYTFVDKGLFSPTTKININQCNYLKNDMTIYVKGQDLCLQEKIKNNFGSYECDMDKDSIPDICDDDIDGDGKKNLLGILIFENKDCSISIPNENTSYANFYNNQIYPEVLKQHFKGICYLDNAPFISNTSQDDLNLDGIGDVMSDSYLGGNSAFISMSVGDSDGDGILDYKDECRSIQETYNKIDDEDGCPEVGSELYCYQIDKCGNGYADTNESCDNCPIDIGICSDYFYNQQITGLNEFCGDGKLNPGESCNNCPEDVGNCENTGYKDEVYCGNGKIEIGENCFNCPIDVGICTSVCGNKVANPGETCLNCSEDIGNCAGNCGNSKIESQLGEQCDNGNLNGKDGKCSIICKNISSTIKTCGNGKIDLGETCENCPEDVQRCTSLCGNGKIESQFGEQCDNGSLNGNDDKCSFACKLIYSPNYCGNGIVNLGETCENCPEDIGLSYCGIVKPYCGNGVIESGENCFNCPIDVGICISVCGNKIANPGETCLNCPEDIGNCAGNCGNSKIESQLGEQCDNGPLNGKDGKCSIICKNISSPIKTCGNGKIDLGETCENCPEDVQRCTSLCGNGKIESQFGEQCDNGSLNGNDDKCSFACKLVYSSITYCGNGVIESGENCFNCPIDVGICTSVCGNKIANPGETCENCPEDIGNCAGNCGNGKIESQFGEQCDNGSLNGKDGKCSIICKNISSPIKTCGNGKIDLGETCENCPEDVQRCISFCGNGKIESQFGEQCDNGSLNGKDDKCSFACKIIVGNENGKIDTCGNSKIDTGENCQNCPIDLGVCISICGNGFAQPGETCKNCSGDVHNCYGGCGNGVIEPKLGEQCDNGVLNGKNGKCSSICKNIYSTIKTCGNGIIETGEICTTCPYDIMLCFSLCGDGKIETQLGEQCDDGAMNGKNGKCSFVCTNYTKPDTCDNGLIEPDETCENCPEDIGECYVPNVDPNVDPNEPVCGNGKLDPGESCISCPKDVGTCKETIKITSKDCNQCPCPFSDFDGDIRNKSKVRSTLWSQKAIIPYVSSAPWIVDF